MAPSQNIHVHLHLQHALTSDVLNSVRCMDPNTDVLEQLNMYIHEEIEHLYDHIQHMSGSQLCVICVAKPHSVLNL